MTLISKLTDLLKEAIIDLKKSSDSWYDIVREEQPESTRFSLGCFENYKGKFAVIYDRKSGKKKSFSLSGIETDIEITKTEEPKKEVLVNEKVSKIIKKGIIKDANNYLKNAKLDEFIHDKVGWRVAKFKNKEWICVPYTTFDLFPEPIGANMYAGKGGKNKRFLKGTYVGSFHPHNFEKKNNKWILGEGFLDCFLAASLLEGYNVLEVGGLSKYKNVLQQIVRLYPDDQIILLGEQGAENVLSELKTMSPLVSVTYPPEGKDFSDYYLKNRNIKEILCGEDIKQPEVSYKPLGVSGDNMVVYSKLLHTVAELNPDKPNNVIRQCIKPSGFEEWTTLIKQQICNKIYENCAVKGVYAGDDIYGIGLFKNKKDYFFNTGDSIYRLDNDKLTKVKYMDVVDNKFLITKSNSEQPLLYNTNFTDILPELDDLLRSCDWEHSFYGAMLLGFMAQSLYAGSIEFRPNVWIFSNGSSAGKTWLSGWLTENLLPLTKKRESSKSSEAGSRQVMKNNSILFHCDELGEKGSQYTTEIKKMIELMRSAASSKNPVLLGTSDQNPVYQKLQFSTLVSVINGREYITEPDYYRFVFLNMVVGDKNRFNNELLPRFRALENEKTLGFTYHALNSFFKYQIYYNKFLTIIKGNIGHRIRGLSSIFAGYAALYRDFHKGLELYKESLKDREMYSPFFSDEGDEEDVGMELFNEVVEKKWLPNYVESPKNFLKAADDGDLEPYGIYIGSRNCCLYIHFTKAYSFLEKAFNLGIGRSMLRRTLMTSKTFEAYEARKIKGKSLKVMVFNV